MTISSDDRNTQSTWHGFPGGHARLPRLSRADSARDGPEVVYVESAFLHDPSNGDVSDAPSGGFETYYSTESLYESTSSSLSPEPDRGEGPYAVLGLPVSASWEEVAREHRSLVSELHPDRYVDADDAVRDAAERRVRDVNEAFATIRRERSGRAH